MMQQRSGKQGSAHTGHQDKNPWGVGHFFAVVVGHWDVWGSGARW